MIRTKGELPQQYQQLCNSVGLTFARENVHEYVFHFKRMTINQLVGALTTDWLRSAIEKRGFVVNDITHKSKRSNKSLSIVNTWTIRLKKELS